MNMHIMKRSAFLVFTILQANIILSHGLASETVIKGPAADIPVSQISVGDTVESLGADGKVCCSEVIAIFQMQQPIVKIEIEGGALHASRDQRFFVIEKDTWVRAVDLKGGQHLQANGGLVVQVQGISQLGVVEAVWAISLDKNHTYFVSEHQILTHNFFIGIPLVFVFGAGGISFSFAGSVQALGCMIAFGVGHKLYEGTCNFKKPNKEENGDQGKEKPKDDGKKSDKKPGDKDGQEEHPNGTYEDAPYHHQNSKGKKGPAPKDGQKALDDSILADQDGESTRRVSVNGDDIVVLDNHEPGKYHGHVREYRTLPNEIKATLHKYGKVNLRGKILK